MMGGMSGGGMGFIFAPESKHEAQFRLQQIMSETKKKFEHGIPFAMEPVVYDFRINDLGTFAELNIGEDALFAEDYYTLILPKLLKKDLQELTTCQQKELLVLSKNYKSKNQYTGFINNLFDRIIPQAQEDKMQQKSLSNLLKEYGFNPGQHQQIKKDLQSGRIGLAKNRLAINTTIEDVNEDELALQQTIYGNIKYTEIGIKALQNKELAIVTLAGGVGSTFS